MSTFISRADSRRQARGRKKKEVLRLPSLFFRIFASGFNCYTTWLEGKAGKWNIIFAVCLVMAKTHTGPSRGQPEAALACLERNSVPARDFSIKIPSADPTRRSLGAKKPWKPKQKAFLVVSSRLKGKKSPNTIHSEQAPIVYQIPVLYHFPFKSLCFLCNCARSFVRTWHFYRAILKKHF